MDGSNGLEIFVQVKKIMHGASEKRLLPLFVGQSLDLCHVV